MPRADHPAGRSRRCGWDQACPEPPGAKATWVTFPGMARTFVTLTPLHVPGGTPVCVDHGHHAVDLMLLRATPEPTPGRRA